MRNEEEKERLTKEKEIARQQFRHVKSISKSTKKYDRSENVIGQRVGRYTILRQVRKGLLDKPRLVQVRCDCGTEKIVNFYNLKVSLSCGCWRRQWQSEFCGDWGFKHGLIKTPAYRSWSSMIQRCENPKNRNYRYWGGRGIWVCTDWHSFQKFFEDMGQRPKGLTLERINNELGYYKENCKWATRLEQNNNSRQTKRLKV